MEDTNDVSKAVIGFPCSIAFFTKLSSIVKVRVVNVEGASDGVSLGSLDGLADGVFDGLSLGLFDGLKLGFEDGHCVGFEDGFRLG